MSTPKSIKVYIGPENPLARNEIKYCFKLLLKTSGFPYHFIESEKEADIIYSNNADTLFNSVSSSKLVIHAMPELKECLSTDFNGSITEERSIPFLIFGSNSSGSLVKNINNRMLIKNDIIFSVFYLLTGAQEKWLDRNRRDIHDVTQSLLYQNNYFYKPIVNIYSGIIRRLFIKSHCPVAYWPENKSYAVAFSHDCDYPEIKRPIEALRYIVMNKFSSSISKIFEILFSRKQTFWNFEEYCRMYMSCGFKAAFYFYAIKGSMLTYYFSDPDPFYDISAKKFMRLFSYMGNNGFEIGLHASYSAYKSAERFKKERARLIKFSGSKVRGNRHHYWHVNPNDFEGTAVMHQSAGFMYDSSLAFEKHCGFRRSISTPFCFFDSRSGNELKVLQIPTALLDDHLFAHLKINSLNGVDSSENATPEKIIDKLVSSVKESNGILFTDYHVRVLNTDLYPGFRKSYKYLLDKISADKDYYSDTPERIAEYWMERDKKLEQASIDDTAGNGNEDSR